jgi:hypothetical protein
MGRPMIEVALVTWFEAPTQCDAGLAACFHPAAADLQVSLATDVQSRAGSPGKPLETTDSPRCVLSAHRPPPDGGNPSVAAAWGRFAIAAIAAALVILWLGRNLTFFYDELIYLKHQPASLGALFQPWNFHWTTGLYLVYQAILTLFGERYYLPFQMALVLFHVATAAGMYALVRTRASAYVAVASTMVLLFLGVAWEDLFWAWQISFIGSCAFGTWATVLAARNRAGTASVLLLGAVMFSGVGLAFVAAVAVLLAREQRRSVAWIALPTCAFAAWQVSFGRGETVTQNPFAPATLVQLPAFASQGATSAVGATFGVGPVGGLLLLVASIWVVFRRGASALMLWACTGLLVLYLLVSLTRSNGGHYAQSRYLYPAAVFILIGSVELLAEVRRPTIKMVGNSLLAIAFLANLAWLATGPYGWGPTRYQLPAAFGCIPVATIIDARGLTAVPVAARCQGTEAQGP